MNTHFVPKYNTEMITIHPGEYYATDKDQIIATVLGSCIAVAIHDPRTHRGGLNHFMLPGVVSEKQVFTSMSGKYGMYAMELLINELVKMGSRKADLQAKVFGGASVLKRMGNTSNKIPESNILFALDYLQTERIPIINSDVGGDQARKVLFYPQTFKVLLRRLSHTLIEPISEEEMEYLRKLRNQKNQGGDLTLFK